MAPTGREAIDALSSCILKTTRLGRRRLEVVFDQHIGVGSMKKFESTYDRITRESRAEGKAEGRIEMLLHQLARRFGRLAPDQEGRVRRGLAKDVARWCERVLDAQTLKDVSAPGRSG